jgi:2-aminomuconate deaminase
MHARWVTFYSFQAWGQGSAGQRKFPVWNWMSHSVFQNVKHILEDAGSSWDKLVDVTVYLTNMKDDFPKYNRLWAEYFKENPPCRTTIEINCLPTPIAIELKCIATI